VRILFISPSNEIGGAEMSLLEMVKYLSARGYEISVALPRTETNRLAELLAPYSVSFLFVKSMNIFYQPGQPLRRRAVSYAYATYKAGWHLVPVLKILRFIKNRRIQLVHTNSLLSVDGAIAARLAGIPHVQHIREITGRQAGSIGRLFLQETPFFRFYNKHFQTAVICNSAYTRKLNEKYFPANEMHMIYNPVSSMLGAPARKDKASFVIGVVANLTATMKNHQLVVRIAKAFKQRFPGEKILFKFFGKLPENESEYLKQLRQAITTAGLEDIFSFEGTRPREILFNEIDLLIHPCRLESFGRIYIEAMSAGVPVIGFKGGSSEELIHHGETGFICSEDDLDHVADCIYKLKSDQHLYKRMSAAALESSKTFLPERIGARLIDLYDHLVNRPKSVQLQ
jgi:glycosyltransferase involved in cell wall biosynthesis